MRPLIAASPARRDSASDSAPLSGEALQAASSNSASAPPEFFVIPRPSSTATVHAPHRSLRSSSSQHSPAVLPLPFPGLSLPASPPPRPSRPSPPPPPPFPPPSFLSSSFCEFFSPFFFFF